MANNIYTPGQLDSRYCYYKLSKGLKSVSVINRLEIKFNLATVYIT